MINPKNDFVNKQQVFTHRSTDLRFQQAYFVSSYVVNCWFHPKIIPSLINNFPLTNSHISILTYNFIFPSSFFNYHHNIKIAFCEILFVPWPQDVKQPDLHIEINCVTNQIRFPDLRFLICVPFLKHSTINSSNMFVTINFSDEQPNLILTNRLKITPTITFKTSFKHFDDVL